MTDIAALEKFFRTSVIALADVTACIKAGSDPVRSFNSIAPPKSAMPYHTFQVIPLNDNTGQARTSIQSRFLVDSKFLSTTPLPATVDAAINAVKEFFRTSYTFDSDGYRISIRHERPISYVETGVTADERIIHRGSTFRVWMSTV